ncbi:MAG: Gx transporter family protein [Oscillospiraceae bacterium]|nr:Gx transporter family protein [Oscillospiraceae bacterium]
MNVRKLCTLALLTAAALVIFVAEAQIPPIIAVPGVKLGLSNIIVLLTMYIYGRREGTVVLGLKIVLGSIFAGQLMSFFYSAAGGLLCLGVMSLLKGMLTEKQIWATSAFGAAAHNIGQLIVAIAILGTDKLVWYLPVLLASGIITGLFTGLCAQITLPRLRRAMKL